MRLVLQRPVTAENELSVLSSQFLAPCFRRPGALTRRFAE